MCGCVLHGHATGWQRALTHRLLFSLYRRNIYSIARRPASEISRIICFPSTKSPASYICDQRKKERKKRGKKTSTRKNEREDSRVAWYAYYHELGKITVAFVYVCLSICVCMCVKRTFSCSLDGMIVRRCRKHTYVQLPPDSFFLTPLYVSFFFLFFFFQPPPRYFFFFTRVSVECDDSDRGSVQGGWFGAKSWSNKQVDSSTANAQRHETQRDGSALERMNHTRDTKDVSYPLDSSDHAEQRERERERAIERCSVE